MDDEIGLVRRDRAGALQPALDVGGVLAAAAGEPGGEGLGRGGDRDGGDRREISPRLHEHGPRHVGDDRAPSLKLRRQLPGSP